MRTSSRWGGRLTRRTFLTGAAAVAGGAMAWPGQAVARGRRADALRVAVVGVGGRGADDLHDLEPTGARIVALCDCDDRQAAASFKAYPEAARYTDWRRLLDKSKDFDAVLVATPDHNHAIVSVSAMSLGKGVYCEKPLAHSIWEAREMARVAGNAGVATQMGTQGHAYEGTRQAVEVLRAGLIGDVREVHVWTDRPAGWWPQGITRPTDTPAVPDGLDWDVWLGPAPARPYNDAYVPFKWRGFWDFGTGAIGDMGIHNLDTAYWGLELGVATSVTIKDCSPALTDPAAKETAPLWSLLDLSFPARGERPPVTVHWYDGGKLPPKELFQGEKLITHDGGSLIIGSKGTLFTRTWHGGETPVDWFVLLPRERFADVKMPEPWLPRTKSHHQEWVDACMGQGQTQSPFHYAARLTESLLLGDVALRAGASLTWDADSMTGTGAPGLDGFVRPTFRAGWW